MLMIGDHPVFLRGRAKSFLHLTSLFSGSVGSFGFCFVYCFFFACWEAFEKTSRVGFVHFCALS